MTGLVAEATRAARSGVAAGDDEGADEAGEIAVQGSQAGRTARNAP